MVKSQNNVSTGELDMLEQQTPTKIFDELPTLDEKFEYAKSMHLIANFEEGLSYFRILKSEYESIERYDKVIDCLGWICQNLANLGRVEEVYNYLPEYKSYCNDYGTILNNLKLNTYLGFISASIGEGNAAIEYYKEALSIAKQLQDTKRLITISLNLQAAYLLLKDLEQAYEIKLEIESIFKQHPTIKTTKSEATYYLNYATILLECKRLNQIPMILDKVKQIPQIDKHKRESMYIESIKGRYYNELNKYIEAIEVLNNSYDYLEATREEPYFTNILEALVKAYEKTNDYKMALHYANKLNAKLIDQEKKAILRETIKVTKQLDFENMQQLVYIDGLTTIHNRRYFEKEGIKLIEQANRTGENMHCAIIDIDLFKQINDRFGHLVGDQAISQLANTIKDTLPKGQLYARYGGDEFVFLFTNVERVEPFFQELFHRITNFEFKTAEIAMKITISMGVASLNDCQTKSLATLVDIADQALYHSKIAGRNLLSYYMK